MPLIPLAIVVAVILMTTKKGRRAEDSESLSQTFTAEERFQESERRRQMNCEYEGTPFPPSSTPGTVGFTLLLIVALVGIVIVMSVWVSNAYNH